MKRKLFLFFGTLIIILLAFGTYQMFVPGISIFDPTYHIRRPNFGTSGGGPIGIGKVKEFNYTDYTADGRKRGTFNAKDWSQEDDGSFSLTNPSAVMYQKDGTRTYMTADRGWIEGEQVAKGITVRRGRFEGNVVIYFDQSKEIDRKHPQNRTPEEVLRDCIRISMNDIEFSQELLELRTSSEIYLWSKTVDLVGKGLVILWNDSPRELRLLKILDGDIMLIKELPEQMDMIQLPTQTLAEKKRKENEKAEELKNKTPAPKVLVEKPAPATMPASPTLPTDAQGEFEITLTETVDSQGNTEPAQTMKIVRRGDDDARNIYEAKFNDNVRVFSGQRKLIGAALLTLKFEWDRAWRQGGNEKTAANTDSQALRDMSEKSPASAPADVAATKPAKGKKVAMARPKGDNWMEIYWDGPLEIKPVGKTDSPDRKRCTLTGEGPAVLLSDADARIICKQFSFENPQQEATFKGAADFPVRMMLARGDEIECDGLVRFVRSEGKAYLDGPGSMNRYAKGGETGSTGEDYMLLPHLPDAASDLTEKITWQGNVVASFDEVKTGKTVRPFLKDAEFSKKVFIERFMPDGKPSDYVHCDKLNVDIAATPQGKAYPRQVTARGNVNAFQQGSKVLSRFIQIDFVPRGDQPATAAAGKKQGVQISGLDGARVEPSYIRARGDVDITYVDPKKPEEQPMRLVGQTLDSDLLKRLAVVTGKPAKIWQGTNEITGDVIFFDEPAEAVKVEGSGVLAFTTKQDFSGTTSAQNRNVRVKWNRDMLYHGQSGLALFNGDVDLVSGKDVMLCDQMKLRFLKQKADIASVVAANKKEDQPLGLNIDRYSKRQIASIEAIGNAKNKQLAILQTSTNDPLNPSWLEKRMQLRGQRIIYNALTGEAEVKGTGTLLAEDYRLPEKKTSSTGATVTDPQNMDGVVDRPSQTMLVWGQGMQLDQRSRHVTVEGNVNMKHRSGNQIDASKVSIQPMDSLRSGRTSGLRADKLDVWFAEPKEGTVVAKPSDMLGKEGPQLGPVKQFVADGNVTFSDNNRKVDGRRVVYEYEDDGPVVLRRMLKVFGYLPGEADKKNARLTISDPYTGRVQTVETPEITYDLLNERIKTGKVSAGGGY